MVRYVVYLFVLIVIVACVGFAVLNQGDITVNYWLGQRNFSFAFFTILVFAAGYFIGLMMGLCLQIKARIRNYHLSKRLKVAEEEIRNLRTIPLQDRP